MSTTAVEPRALQASPSPWAQAFALTAADVEAGKSFAVAMAAATVIPRQYRGQPGNVFWAVSFAQMTGLHPVAVMDQVWFTDEGKPAAHATLIATLVRRAGHTLRVTGDATSATAVIERGDSPGNLESVTFDLDDARIAGLIQRVEADGTVTALDADGNPTHWQLYTKALLKARATTAAARQICPEALFGLCYTPEELGARIDAEGKATGRATPGLQQQRPQSAVVERWLKTIEKANTPQALDAAGTALANLKEQGKLDIDEAGHNRLSEAYRERMHALGITPPRAELPAAAPADATPTETPQTPPAEEAQTDDEQPSDAGNEPGDWGMVPDDIGEQAAADVQQPGLATEEPTDEPDEGWGSWGEADNDNDPWAALSDEDPMDGSESGELFMARATAAAAQPHP